MQSVRAVWAAMRVMLMTMAVAWALLRVGEPVGAEKPTSPIVKTDDAPPEAPSASNSHDMRYDELLMAIGTAVLCAGMVVLFARPLDMSLTAAVIMGAVAIVISLVALCGIVAIKVSHGTFQKKAFWGTTAFIALMAAVLGYIASLGL